MKRLLTVLALLAPSTVFAGNPSVVVESGLPARWPGGGRGIVIRPDQGPLGVLTNDQAIAQTADAGARWTAISSSTVELAIGAALPLNVTAENYLDVELPLGTNPVIYDDDGAIVEMFFGRDSGILGFADISWNTATGDILGGNVVINGGCLLPTGCSFGLPNESETFASVQTHELGHFLGLDHSVVNGQILIDPIGPDTAPMPWEGPPPNDLEVMYPSQWVFEWDGRLISVFNGDVPQKDDVAILSFLYPEPAFAAGTGAIVGTVRTATGRSHSGVNVVARNVADPLGDAVSAISGNLAAWWDPADPRAGTFALRNLTPGARYVVHVDGILRGSFFTFVVPTLPGPEEYHNGFRESADPALDDPADFVAIEARAGVEEQGVDIVFNRRPPGPLPLGDEDFVELPLPFPFELCGERHDAVFVGANGELQFRFSEPAPAETGALLTGVPRVAGVWTDLDPSAGGVVSADWDPQRFTVRWDGVPEWSNGGSNTFAITLWASRPGQPNRVTLAYGSLDAEGGLAGYSCGSSHTSGWEAETDLSSLPPLVHGTGAALFEDFALGGNDLDGRELTIVLAPAPADVFEPNDSLASARRVTLPFDTASEVATIGASDADHYRFAAKAGDLLLAETFAPANWLDTQIALYRLGRGGATLVAANDDTVWPFSRLLVTLPADGEYALAVTASFGEGRYTLSVGTYRGTDLNLGDDEAVELPLGFPFSYQGQTYTSVWLNSDGNLTFGESDTATTARGLARFLNGPPRIAAMFQDLDTTGSITGVTGRILAERKEESLTVHWLSVPFFFVGETNTFSITLRADGGVRTSWGAVSRFQPWITGITEGRGAADPGASDLSSLVNWSPLGTTYERYVGWWNPFDLAFGERRFARKDP